MKYILLIILSILILINSSNKLEQCTTDTVKLAIPPRIWEQQSLDGANHPVLATRFFHNKVGIFMSEISKCYFNIFDPKFIFYSVGLIGLFFWFYSIYYLSANKKWFYLILILLIPIPTFFNYLTNLVPFAHKIIAIIGVVFFMIKRK